VAQASVNNRLLGCTLVPTIVLPHEPYKAAYCSNEAGTLHNEAGYINRMQGCGKCDAQALSGN